MRSKGLFSLFGLLALVSFSYIGAQGQVVDAVKDAAGKTKDVTKKTAVVVTDGLEKAADKTADVTVDAAKTTASKSKSFGNKTVTVTENVAGQSYEGGKWFVVTTWDGSKWVSKRVWYKTKKAADAVQ